MKSKRSRSNNNNNNYNNKLSKRAHAYAYAKGESFSKSSAPELASEIYNWLLRVGLVDGVGGEDTRCEVSGIPSFTLVDGLEIADLRELVAAAVEKAD